MRTRKWMGVATGLSLCALMLDVQPSQGQRGGGPPDPERSWGFMLKMSGGTDTVDFAKMDPRMKEMMQKRSQQQGTPPLPETGVWTKDQFLDHFNKSQAIMAANGTAPGGPGGFGRGPRVSSPEDIAKNFDRYDTNKDGKISLEEAARSPSTAAMFKDFDKNADGFLDLAEYTALRQARDSGAGPQPPGMPAPAAAVDPNASTMPMSPPPTGRDDRANRKTEDARPVVYRYGKLPKEVPSWFTDLDTDKDGQIGLYEWRKAGRPMREFAEMDLNDDGFVTAEEWLRFQKLTQEKAHHDELVASVSEGGSPLAASTSSSSSSSGGSSSRPGSRGPWGGGASRDSTPAGDSTNDKSNGGDRGGRSKGGDRSGKRGGNGFQRPPRN